MPTAELHQLHSIWQYLLDGERLFVVALGFIIPAFVRVEACQRVVGAVDGGINVQHLEQRLARPFLVSQLKLCREKRKGEERRVRRRRR